MKKFFIKFLNYIICLLILSSSFPSTSFGQINMGSNFITPGGSNSDNQIGGSGFNISRGQGGGGYVRNPGAMTGGGDHNRTPLSNDTLPQQIFSGTANRENMDDPTKGGILPSTEEKKQQTPGESAVSEGLSCSIGAILGNAITRIINGALNHMLGSVKKTVPTEPVDLSSKEVGVAIFGIPILPSWDAMGYCLANALIVYVADSTIAWIQSGFEGKPSFVDNPEQLFKDLADYEMSSFLENIADGILCEPFNVDIKLGLIEEYTDGQFPSSGRCTLDTVNQNVDDFLSGKTFSFETLSLMGSNPINTPSGSYQNAKNNARNFIELQAGPIKKQIDWGNGYLYWQIKEGPRKGQTVTPGQVIEEQLSQRLGLSTDRLVLAEKFDQVISALVNYLIKAALSETINAFQ